MELVVNTIDGPGGVAPAIAAGVSAESILDIRLVARMDQVSVVRTFLEQFLGSSSPDPDLLARVTVAAHELLENAAKYSSQPGARLRTGIEKRHGRWCGWVEVANQGAPEHVDDLRMTVQELEDPATAVEMYQIDMLCSALKGDASGLGLARIRAELEMDLSLRLEGETVWVTATASTELL